MYKRGVRMNNLKVDAFIQRQDKWQDEIKLLRSIISECNLDEEIKWGKPCYTFEGANIVLIQPFKETVSLAYMKGGLLKDPHHILETIGQSVEGKVFRFKSVDDINEVKEYIIEYIYEAIENEKLGLKFEKKPAVELPIPPELTEIFNDNEEFKEAFYRLTPGRQKSYLFHFNGAKQSKTVISRIEKCMDKIYDGKGFNE